MKKNTLKLAVAASAMTMIFAGCGDDVLVSEEVAQSFTTVKSINPKDCNDKTEGSMAFVKDESTMYVCTDGEWIALNDQDAIEYRCETKSFSEKKKSGVKIICDGDTIGTVYNGEKGDKGDDGTNGKNGKNGDNADMDAVEKAIKDGLKDASEELGKEVDDKLSSASANHDEDIKNLDDKLSSASAKSELDNDELDKKLSSLAEEYDKSCKLNAEPEYSKDGKTVTISVKCGEAEKKFVANLDDENLKKVYKKHVVVRFPVYAEKTTSSEDVYEEIWKNIKGGNHTELTVVDLDEKLNATGKMFVTDLFADATKSGAFVTVEETNKKKVEYKVARLEGDIEVTNLSNPLAQLRIKMNMTNANGGFTFGGNGSSSTEVIYNAFTDLSDESETVVIDFLTDYKAERVKKLVQKGDETFAKAGAQANIELAKALSLVKDPSTLAAFEHYLPGSGDGVGLTEYFNGVVWVMALIDQGNKVPDFNKVYNEYRKVFAENGDFNQAIETTYAGKKQSMFFVDYLALLINANFFKWNCALDADGNVRPMMLYNGECETDDYLGHDEIYYKILQDGFVSAYKLDTTKAVEFDKDSKIQKPEVEGGHFRYFEYYRNDKIWYPINTLDGIASAEAGKCDATAANAEIRAVFTVDKADFSMLCQCEMDECSYGMVDPCQGRDEGYEGFAYFGTDPDLSAYVCKKECYDSDGNLTDGQSGTCNIVSYDPSSPSLEDVVRNGKTIDEILNPAEGEGPLGKCTAANKDVVKSFDEKDAERSTTTGYGDYICNGAKWVKASPVDLYCVGDNVKATEQKVADEDLAALGLKYDQKCEFEDVLYVRNSEEAGSEWADATGYIRRAGRGFVPRAINGARIIDIPVGYETLVTKLGIRDSVYVFMNGYKENAIYKCIDGECSELSDDNAITKFVDQFRDEKGKNSFTSTDSLSIFCNKAEYKKAASGYVAGIAYEVELGNAASKTKYVASANRKDWHEVGPSDLYGECSESVMKNAEANWVTVGGQKYACDCDQNGDKLECDWRKGTATETAVDKPCTKNIADAETVTLFNGPNSKVYLCKYTPIPGNLGAHDLVEATVVEAFGECNDAKMKAQTKLSMFGETAYKCDCQHDYEYDIETLERNDVYKDCEWTVASDLEKTLNDPCTANRAWNDVKTFSKAPKKDVYYCETTVEAFDDVKEVHDWTEMTAAAWCSNNWDYTQGGHYEVGSDYASAICKGNPVDHHTYIYTNSTGGGGLRTAEVFFTMLNYLNEEISCAGNKKYITSLTNTEDDYPNETFYHYEGSNGQPGPLVHDFICKEGYLVEASGVQEACNAAFEKTDICTYMKEYYRYEGTATEGEWKKITITTAEQYCDLMLEIRYGVASCSTSDFTSFCESHSTEEVCDANGWVDFSCVPPSNLEYTTDGCSSDGQYRCEGSVGSSDFNWTCSGV